MANLFKDSFQHYGIGSSSAIRQQLIDKWGAGSTGSGGCFTSATAGRGGGPALVTSWSDHLEYALGTNASTLIGGIRWKGASIPGSATTNANVMYFKDGATLLVTLWIDSSGKLWVSNGSGTALGDSGAWTTAIGGLHYYEMKVLFDGSAGTVQVNVDGIPRITLTGKNTIGGGSHTYGNVFAIGTTTSAGAPTYTVCDAYCNDTTTSLNNDFEGDISIDFCKANGAGHYQQSTIAGSSPAATRWQGVAEVGPDDDVTENSLATGQEDTFTIDASGIPSNAVIRSVSAVARFASDVAGTNNNALLLRSGTTDQQGPDIGTTTAYQYGTMSQDTDPATSAAWTYAGMAASEPGLKKTA